MQVSPSDQLPMVEVQNLRKTFGPNIAVNGVSFSVKKGEVLGFLGPNGAGKSTTMRMITGFMPPSEGGIRVGKFDMTEHPVEAKRLIGYLPENAPSYADMTVHGFLSFVAELRGFTGKARREAVARAIEMCFLKSVVHQSVDTLSKGYRHRTCFAQSILHDPPILIMDEPTDGLDPNQKHEMRTLIRRMGESKAIIFSTHILEEVEAVCSRAIIIDRGKIVANGTPQELKRRSPRGGMVTVRFAESANAESKLHQLAGVKKVDVLGNDSRIFSVQGELSGGWLGAAIYDLAVREHWKIEDLHAEEGRLDDVFRSITLSDTQVEVSK